MITTSRLLPVSLIRLCRPLSVGLGVVCASLIPLHAQQTTGLLEERFPESGPSNGWFYSRGATYLTPAPGSLTVNPRNDDKPNDFSQLLTYFSPTTLGAGDSLEVKVSFSLSSMEGIGSGKLRFGLYHSGGESQQFVASGTGPSTSTWFNTDYKGYTAYLNTKDFTGDPIQLFRRDGNNNNLASTSAHTPIGDAQGASLPENSFVDAISYTATYSITRVDEDTLSITMAVTGGDLTSYSGTWTTDATHTELDTFAIVFGDSKSYNSFTLTSGDITLLQPIPEPQTVAALMGAAMFGFVLWRRPGKFL